VKKITISGGSTVKVDDEDYSILSKHTLTKNVSGLVMIALWTKNKKFEMPVSHLIMYVNGGHVITYKDKDNSNLQKENLLAVTYSVFNHKYGNNYSRRKSKTSKYRGVSYSKTGYGGKHWKAQLCYQNKRTGRRFFTEKEAAIYWNGIAKEFFGEDAYQNKLE